MGTRLLHVIFLACSLITGQAQNKPGLFGQFAPAVDSMYSRFATRAHAPGLVYGIIMNGQMVHRGALGFANLEKQLPANNQSAFRIASMTKSFISVAILQLRDKGRLSLDDRADKYIPELRFIKYVTSDPAPITVRNLLTHSAGFPEDNPWGDRQLDISDDDMLSMFKRGISMSTNPGTGYEYSNMGFAMLGYIIKKVTGKSFQEYLQENVFKPLGMNHTYWEYAKIPEQNLALGYRHVSGQWVKQPMLHDGAYGAMGGLITTLEDFTKYLLLHLNATQLSNKPDKGPLKRSSIREIQQPWQFSGLTTRASREGATPCAITSAYGYGLRWTKDCKGMVQIGHSGGLPGFGSNWTILPDYGIGIICFANVTYAPAASMNAEVLDTLIGLMSLKPRRWPVSPILEQRKNELIELLPDWEVGSVKNIFAVNFFDDYFIDSLKKESKVIFDSAGKLSGLKDFIPENNLRGTFIIAGANHNIQVTFTLSPENPAKIQSFRIRSAPK